MGLGVISMLMKLNCTFMSHKIQVNPPLGVVMGWMSTNGLKVSPEKTALMTVSVRVDQLVGKIAILVRIKLPFPKMIKHIA